MTHHQIVLSQDTLDRATGYLRALHAGTVPGRYLWAQLEGVSLAALSTPAFLALLVNTKQPQIFAECAVSGDGSDWTQEELGILGDLSIATPVTVFDDGAHANPQPHASPFDATLVFTPGALLRNGRGQVPADWNEVIRDGRIDPDGYYRLYERRLLPALRYINEHAGRAGQRALVTLPGLGCCQFAGPFQGQLGEQLKRVLIRLLDTHGAGLDQIQAVYFDPYRECGNERLQLHGISLLVRPLTQGNAGKHQLCAPVCYQEDGDDFSQCALYSFVAWDHVSWPGNDFYVGSRATDDGVKAAATSSMTTMTGIAGVYDARTHQYQPPADYRSWGAVVARNGLRIRVDDNLRVY